MVLESKVKKLGSIAGFIVSLASFCSESADARITDVYRRQNGTIRRVVDDQFGNLKPVYLNTEDNKYYEDYNRRVVGLLFMDKKGKVIDIPPRVKRIE